jgi:acyl transferase domain-containing protein/acyl carrier protein/2-polyprenyl-3-methyl-5-hydroxy-6-metoxy-1,4-benzoquinol methylase
MSKAESRPRADSSALKRALIAIDDLQARLAAAERFRREPIAVIGIGCRFPGGATGPDRFWRNLLDGLDAVGEIPPERWSGSSRSDEERKQISVREAALVDRVHDLDAQFFGASAHAAKHMDPQHKMLLEVTWEALEHAGLSPVELDGSRTGVFNGLWAYDYWTRLLGRSVGDLTGMEGESMHSFAAGRISYGLNLHGPSFVLDTACSTSLVTTHLACQSLRAGECDIALAGGVNVILDPALFHVFSFAQVLSPDGRCKSFDASANGFGRGEGCGVVVLKRYGDAIKAGDRILALIRGSAVNHDGRGTQLAVPNASAQQMAYRQALAQAGIRASEVTYVEAHGTGTAVGDPAEMEAVRAVYGEDRNDDDPLLVGSVKTNIGHLESASGIAGLIKAVLALHTQKIPPNLHFKTPNPRIPWGSMPIRVVDKPTDWPRGSRTRFAAVSAFGITGTNAHLVLEEAPLIESAKTPQVAPRSHHVLCLSAKGGQALNALSLRYEEHLRTRNDQALENICFTANTGRAHFRHRLCVVGATHEEVADRLAKLRDEKKTALAFKSHVSSQAPRIAFMFPGQGAQYAGMGHRLYETEPAFRVVMDRCEARYQELKGRSLLQVMHAAAETNAPIDETEFTQPALYAIECALATWLRDLGVEPTVVLGHSVGEYAAAYVAGVFSLEHGLELIARRAELMQALPLDGAMAAVLADSEVVRDAIAGFSATVSIAAENAPSQTVISGRADHVDKILEALARDGVEAKRLRVSHAFHSPLIEPMMSGFLGAIRDVDLAAPAMPLISNVSGGLVEREVAEPSYWVEHIRKPVRFADGLRTARSHGCDVFLEIGPSPTLIGFARRTLEGDGVRFVTCLQRGKDDCQSILGTLAELHVNGAIVDWHAFDRGRNHQKVTLPTYAFQRQRYEIVASHREAVTDLGAAVKRLLECNDQAELLSAFQAAGGLTRERAGLAAGLLALVADKGDAPRSDKRSVAADYYNALPAAMAEIDATARGDDQGFLTFGPFDEKIPGFSWIRAIFDPNTPSQHLQACHEAQRRLRTSLFRHVDFGSVKRAMDFGCGYGSDLIELARKHPHLECYGYTIAANQAAIASQKIEACNLRDRVHVFNRDSARNSFPSDTDLVFGFEVAHHILDKDALFANVETSLRDGGLLVLADFISHAEFSIDHQASSSYFITVNEWVEVLSSHQLCVVDSIDISPEISNFLHDPDFDAHFDLVEPFKRDPNIRASFKSYDQLGKLLKNGLASYVLITARKRTDLDRAALAERNREALSNQIPYSTTTLSGSFTELAWRPVSVDSASVPKTGRWLIFADRQGVGRALADILSTRGASCVIVHAGDALESGSEGEWTVDPQRPEHFRRLVRETSNGSPGFSGVVLLWPIDVPSGDALDSAALDAAQATVCAGTLHLAQSLVHGGHPGRIWVVTQDARVIAGDGDASGVAATTVHGLCLSMAWEYPKQFGAVIDLEAASPRSMAKALVDAFGSAGVEPLLARRQGRWLAARLTRRSAPADAQFAADPNGTYLITGGLGALGQAVAEWLVGCGARQLTLVSRSTSLSDQQNGFVAHLQSKGVDVRVAPADVSDQSQLEPVFHGIRSTSAPLRGVFHIAGVLDDGALLEQSWDRFRGVLSGKVQGAWNLHRLSRADELQCFVCFSSASSMLGSPGQSNYAAANAFLDALAWHRRSRGLPALTVNWGAWGEVGMAARLSAVHRRQLAAKGLRDIPPAQGLAALGALLGEQSCQVGVIPIDWARLRDDVPDDGLRSLLGEVLPTQQPASERAPTRSGTPSSAASPLDAIRAARAEERKRLITEFAKERIAAVLGFDDVSAIDDETPLMDLGFDSLMAVQLRNRIQKDFRVDVEIASLIQTVDAREVGRLVDQQLSVTNLLSASPDPGERSSVKVEIV